MRMPPDPPGLLSRLWSLLRRLLEGEEGGTKVEYALLVALLGVAAATLTAVATGLGGVFGRASGSVGGPPGEAIKGAG